jgi:hypothetical protein
MMAVLKKPTMRVSRSLVSVTPKIAKGCVDRAWVDE